jgi:hypothetical protein
MDEIVKLVQERTGIDEGQAKTAVETVVNFIKDRLPEPMKGQIDGLIGGAGGANPLGGLGNLGGLGG